jgi:hypothetical protein
MTFLLDKCVKDIELYDCLGSNAVLYARPFSQDQKHVDPFQTTPKVELFPILNDAGVWRRACHDKAFIQHATTPTGDNSGESDAEDATPTTTLHLDLVCVVKKRQQRHVSRGIQSTTTQPSRSIATVSLDAETIIIASIIGPTLSHDVRTAPTSGSVNQYKVTDKKVDFTVNFPAPSSVGEPPRLLSVGYLVRMVKTKATLEDEIYIRAKTRN